MSTLSSSASKGEKSKPKFQSLDINSLYRHSRGENTEKTTQKSSSVYIKHGMQSLGKVPSARRPPANLPSLKSEHSGSDAAVPLIPPGATGWGKQDSSTSQSQPPAGAAPPNGAPQAPAQPQISQHQANIALPVTTPIPTPHKPAQGGAPTQAPQSVGHGAAAAPAGDKLWSAVAQPGGAGHHAPPGSHFRNEFPSLGDAAGAGDGPPGGGHPPGPGQRPAEGGAWQQPQKEVLVQRDGPLPPQVRGVLPPFMCKGNYAAPTPGNQTHAAPPQMNGRERRDMSRPPRLMDRADRDVLPEELTPRPIIREEELNKLDEMGRDMGWAVSDDVDYNQKLAFSDDESEKPAGRSEKKSGAASAPPPPQHTATQPPPPQPVIPAKIPQDVRLTQEVRNEVRNERQTPPRQWGNNHNARGNSRGKSSEEEDMRLIQKRQDKEVELAIQRARQRKEEEERRISEVKQRAAQKLKELDEKKKAKCEREREVEAAQNVNANSANAVSPKPVSHAEIPVPEFQRDKTTEKRHNDESFARQNQKKRDGNDRRNIDSRENQNVSFSRQFQNDLPPRFMKNQRSGSQSNYPYENRWANTPQKTQRTEDEQPKQRTNDFKRQNSDNSSYVSSNTNPEEHFEDKKPDLIEDWNTNTEKKDRGKEKYERRSDYMRSWSDDLNVQYEEKNQRREDRRVVPGPITKDRIQAENFDEKCDLTQLKKGEIPKKIVDKKEEKIVEESNAATSNVAVSSGSAWVDSIPPVEETDININKSTANVEKKENKDIKHEVKKSDDNMRNQNRNRNYSQNKSWGTNNSASNEYRSSAWGNNNNSNKRPSSRGYKKGPEYHPTDSDNSADDHDRSKKIEKDEKNKEKQQLEKKKDEKQRDAYIPRGEPSRHGRGGSNSFRGGRMGGMGKRIDGYGPPPSKSPFGHHEDREKKVEETCNNKDENVADKTKQNQEILAAGIIGKGSNREKDDFNKNRKEGRRNKSKGRRDEHNVDSNSENSDGSKKVSKHRGSSSRNRNQGPRLEKRVNETHSAVSRQNSGGKKDEKTENTISETALKDVPTLGAEPKPENTPDSEGFQEVKSKKTIKERAKLPEEKKPLPPKDKQDRRPSKNTNPTQIQNIPPLMAFPVNPPPVLNQKTSYEGSGGGSRARQSKLAPRFAKQKLQKQYQSLMAQDGDIRLKEGVVSGSAWDKPLGPQLRAEHEIGVGTEGKDGQQAQVGPAGDKMLPKPQLTDKTLLDGSNPPVNTIIFENTNFKSAPGSRNKPRPKLEDDSSVLFNKPINDLLSKPDPSKQDPSIPVPLFKEDSADMKLDFFGSDLPLPPASTAVCNADSLNMKIASVKKVWDTSEQGGEEQGMAFGGATIDASGMFKGNVAEAGVEEQHEGYSPGTSQAVSTSTNVCKVKPTQQVSGNSGQTVLNSATGAHQPHSAAAAAAVVAAAVASANLVGNPLSPPPLPQPVLGASVGLGPQQYTANQHLGYQAGLGGSTQFGISAIPSPPTVMYNSATQQIQAAAQSGLYGAFQIDQTGVLGGQGRSQFSQYAGYHSLGQAGGSPYSAQSVYLPTGGPPPTAQPPPPPPELYHGVGGYRLSAAAAAAQPFGQNQGLSNPTTVLISSTTSNSLMSAAVKPSSQQISAIGTKAGGVGQAYQQQSQQGQVYMYDPSLQANYLSSAGVMQRAQAAPVQNSVVPGLQASSSFYSGSTGGQTAPYFQQPTNSTLQNAAAQFQQHQAATYGLQGSVFGTHSQSHTNTAGLQGYNSHMLSTQMQVAAALSAQQYRSGLQNPYVKNVGAGTAQPLGDQSGNRQQQLKSPGSQDVMSSVFNTVPQIPSPKSRPNNKHPQPQSSPTSQRKYNLYQSVNQQNNMQQRYPAPIQRPVNFQQNLGVQGNMPNQKHRQNNKAPNNRQQYYGGQNNGLANQTEKADDSKVSDTKKAGVTPAATSPSEIAKEVVKEETAALKD